MPTFTTILVELFVKPLLEGGLLLIQPSNESGDPEVSRGLERQRCHLGTNGGEDGGGDELFENKKGKASQVAGFPKSKAFSMLDVRPWFMEGVQIQIS